MAPDRVYDACTGCLRWVPRGDECPGCEATLWSFDGQGSGCLYLREGWCCWHCGCPLDGPEVGECPCCRVKHDPDVGWVSVAKEMARAGRPYPLTDAQAYRADMAEREAQGQMTMFGGTLHGVPT